MKKYKQISYEERVTIKICLWKKMSITLFALNLLIAESKPSEIKIMKQIVVSVLNKGY